MISRRLFLVSTGTLIATWRTAAAQTRKTWRIGYLHPATPEDLAVYLQAFRDGLTALGYVEGGNISIELAVAEDVERMPALASDLTARNVDLIVALGTPAARAAKAATGSIPIVFAGPSDPIGSGLVNALARPGGNMTGITDQGVDLAGKRLDLLKQVVPRLKRVLALGSPTDPVWGSTWRELQPAARRLGIDVTPVLMTTPDQLEAIFGGLDRTAQALYVAPQHIFWHHRQQIVSLAARAKLPSMYEAREFVESGGLISYGTDYVALVRDAAGYVDRILKGAFPGDLPVEQPRKFNLAINLSTAKALRLTVPEPLLVLADELIR